MKSKKKLIYKLHENMQDNPFKPIAEISFRNAGVHSCDFNKLRSIRAMSLNMNFNTKSEKANEKQAEKKTLLVNVNEPYLIAIRSKPKQFFKAEKMKLDVKLSNFQKNRLQIYKKIKEQQKNTEENRLSEQNYWNKTQEMQQWSNSDVLNKVKRYQNYTSVQQNSQKKYTEEELKNKTNMKKKNSREISFPNINQKASQRQTLALNEINLRQKFYSVIEQQKARQQILKQIKIRQQQKTNIQILQLIKNKSNKNLQKIGRSQSQFIKIDKWKEKYAPKKISKDKNKKANQTNTQKKQISNPKVILPENLRISLQRISENRDQDMHSQKFSQISPDKSQQMILDKRKLFMNLNEELQNFYANRDAQKSPITKQNIQELSHYQSLQLKRNFSNISTSMLKEAQERQTSVFQIDELNAGQNQKNSNSYQPFKINVTKMKKSEKKNRQNLNLQTNLLKQTRIQEEINKFSKQNQKCQDFGQQTCKNKTEERYGTFSVQTKVFQDKNADKQRHSKQKDEQSSAQRKSLWKISFLSQTVKQKQPILQNEHRQTIFPGPSLNRTKIERQTRQSHILEKIGNETPMKWQDYRRQDHQDDFEFGNFVRYQARQQHS